MQNFKQFLKEEVGNLPTFVILIAPEDDDYAKDYFSQVRDNINSTLTNELNINRDVEIKYENDYVVVTFENLSKELGKRMNEIWITIHTELSELMDLADGFTSVDCDWPPAYCLEDDDALFNIFVKKDGQSFKGIEKLIKGKYIDFCLEGHKIGLLSLARLEDVEMLRVILDKGGKSPEETLMSEIISKHLGHESEKDIIDFQEELIKHGFKEYAKQ